MKVISKFTMLFVIILASSVVISSPAAAVDSCGGDALTGEVVVQDDEVLRHTDSGDLCRVGSYSDITVIEEAIDEAVSGETILIKEKSGSPDPSGAGYGVGYVNPYRGAEISSNKQLTIKGESSGIVGIMPKPSDQFIFDLNEINNNQITFKNIVLVNDRGNYALRTQSNSTAILKNVAIDGSFEDYNNIYKQVESTASSNPTGSMIIEDGVYYPSSTPSKSTVVGERGGGNPADRGSSISVSGAIEEIEPRSNVFIRRSDPLGDNPVVDGSAGNVLFVDNDDSSASDESILNKFKTLQGAVNQADTGTVINVYSSSGGYGSVDIDGSGLSGQHDLTIKRANPSENVRVDSLEFSYSGNYNIDKMYIENQISVDSNNVNVDASRNYWGSSTGPNVDADINIPRGITSSVSTKPFCESSDCSSLRTYEYPYCIRIGGDGTQATRRIGCEGGESTQLEVEIGELQIEGSDVATDVRTFDVSVDSYTETAFEGEVNIIESDLNTDDEFSIGALDGEYEENVRTSFGGVVDDMVSDSQNINPRAEVTINGLDPIVVNLKQETIVDTDGTDIEPSTPEGQSESDSVNIVDDNFEGFIPRQTRSVSRFNAEISNSPFQDNSIPPISTGSGAVKSSSLGELRSFTNMRTNNRKGQAVILPESSSLNVGFKMENVPQAKDHTLVIDYAYQAKDVTSNYLDVRITDENGNVITGTDKRIKPTTGTGDIFTSPTAGESDIGANELVIELSNEETQYVNTRSEFYFQIKNNDLKTGSEVLHIYNSRIISTDNYSGKDPDLKFTDSSSGSGDLAVSMNIDGVASSKGTYDIGPGKEFITEITISNTGEVSSSGTYVLQDIYDVPKQNFPDGSSPSGDATQEKELAKFEDVTVEPGETISRTVEHSWPEAVFGGHEVKLKEKDGDGDLTDIYEDSTPTASFYVEQPTTIGIDNIDVPDERLKLSSFTAEVTLSNIGDLSGEAEITSQFGEWQSVRTVDFARSNARSGEDSVSDEITLTYSRNDFKKSSEPLKRFTRREYTTPTDIISSHHGGGEFEYSGVNYRYDEDNSYYRANAPFARNVDDGDRKFTVEINTQDLKGSAENDVFNAENALRTTKSKQVSVYNLEIKDMKVNVDSDDIILKQRPTEDQATVYASAWPYVYPSYGSNPSDRPNGDTYSVSEGEKTLYSESSYGGSADENVPSNRVSLPLNNETVPRLSYGEEYFSQYYTHQNRVCNPDQLSDREGEVQVPESEASESDLKNVFMAFSATSCDDPNRITNTHGISFVDTSNEGVTTDSADTPADKSTTVGQPSTDETITGVNPDRFDEIVSQNHIMFAYVTVENEGTSTPATARFEIVTDRELPDGRIVGIGDATGGHQAGLGSAQFDDNVVGAAAVDLESGEAKTVPVPIVIRNNKGLDGTHILSVRPRKSANVNPDAEDYIKYTDDSTPPSKLPESPITGKKHDQWTVPIKVETYGDAVLKSFGPPDSYVKNTDGNDPPMAREADMVVNEVCDETNAVESISGSDETDVSRAEMANRDVGSGSYDGTYTPDLTEGVNVQSGDRRVGRAGLGEVLSSGTCDDDDNPTDREMATFEATYTNYGGDPIEIRPEAVTELEATNRMSNLNRKNAHATGDRYIAPYNNYTNTNFKGKTWSKIVHEGTKLDSDEKITIKPGETTSVKLSRKFQEPGMYHVRMKPCRRIGTTENDEDRYGPQYYNMEGFTGIPDSIRNTTSKIASETGWADGRYTTSRTGLSRTDSDAGDPVDGANLHTTPEMKDSIFHGSLGCATKASSVFVYDVTNPVAELRVAHDKTTVMDNQKRHTGAIPQDGSFGFDEENLPPEVNIIFAIDQSGSVGPHRSDMRNDIVQFVESNPNSYNYAYERFFDGGYVVNKDLGEYEDAEEFKKYMKKNTGDKDAPIGSGRISKGYESLEESAEQLEDAAGPNVQNYIIVLGDGDQLDTTGCDDPTEVGPEEDDYEIVGVYFDGRSCSDNLQDESSTVDGEELFYDTSKDINFIQSFNDFENSVIDRPTKVTEGGMLFLDASTVSNDECKACYNRPHFKPYKLETLRESPDFPAGAGGTFAADDNGFRTDLTKSLGNLHSYIMSTDNARIVGRYMPGAYSEGDDAGLAAEKHAQIQKKGMEWEIEGVDPNYGQKNYCEEVEQETADEHCYMERFEGSFGDSGNTPDSYEVVPHRFTEVGNSREVELTVWDDPTLTEGDGTGPDPNKNTTTIDIQVVDDTSVPKASLNKEIFNDLNYDKEDSSGDPTVWSRKEDIYDDNDIDYRSSTPDNFEEDYDDTYEGVRTCFNSEGSDADIGISQDKWDQKSADGFGDGTLVIHDFSPTKGTGEEYVVEEDPSDVSISDDDDDIMDELADEWHYQVTRAGITRDGNHRCVVYNESGPDGNMDRTQNMTYTVWDYDNKVNVSGEEVDIKEDTTDPTIESTSTDYDTEAGDGSPSAVYGHNMDVGFSGDSAGGTDYHGGEVQLAATGSDSGIGTACLDFRLDVVNEAGNGYDPEYGGESINSNCQGIGHEVSGRSTIDSDFDGTHGNFGTIFTSGGGIYSWAGSNNKSGDHSDDNYLTAKELGSEYAHPNSDTVDEDVYLTDWHGNQDSDTVTIDVKEDTSESSSTLGGSYDGCTEDTSHGTNTSSETSDCGTDTISYNTDGTPIVDAKIVDGSLTDGNSCTKSSSGDVSGASCSESIDSVEVSSMDVNQFSGDMTIDLEASVTTSVTAKSANAPSCGGCGPDQHDSTSADSEGKLTGSFDVKVMDAHGNTASKEYSFKIVASANDSDKDENPCPTCPPPPENGGGGGGSSP